MNTSNSLQPQQNTILTFKEAMGFLRISRSTLYRRIWDGDITPFHVGKGKHLRFLYADLLALCQPAELKLTA
jgi:predicted DNA-binding transcriptional regulator AlpA